MAAEVFSSDALAKQLQGLLSTAPPFLTAGALPLLSHLLDPELLNGTSEAESVWHALQELIPAPATLSGTQPPTDLLSSLSESLSSHTTPPEIKCIYTELLVASAADAFQRDDLEVFDDGALCLSAPLHATHPSQVVLAPHSIELVDLPTENSTTVQTAGGSWWDIPWQGGRKLRKRRVLAKKTFFPAADKVSILVAWWGYQVFLPHNIVIELGSEVAPYTSALATISGVLAFIVKNIPSALDLLPGVSQIKALLPILAGIASFAVWYWGRIAGEDKGNGVILAATWLLPIAFVPRTLDPKAWPSTPETVVTQRVLLSIAALVPVEVADDEVEAGGVAKMLEGAEQEISKPATKLSPVSVFTEMISVEEVVEEKREEARHETIVAEALSVESQTSLEESMVDWEAEEAVAKQVPVAEDGAKAKLGGLFSFKKRKDV